MNAFEKLLYFLQGEMNTPTMYGWFHILWVIIGIITIIILYKNKNNYNEKKLKTVLGVYSIVALILETLKQLIWTFNYDPITNLVTWDYEWYSFPFQLCTTPIFICFICLFLKKGKLRDSLLSYLAYVTIVGSIATMIMPDSCFVSDILVNIHTMWLHLGSLVVSIYLLITKEVKINIQNVKSAIIVFLILAGIAEYLNIIVYHSGILNGETFNMFYISPYFVSTLPVFDIIQQNVPFIIFLILYILAISLGAFIIYGISVFLEKFTKKLRRNKNA